VGVRTVEKLGSRSSSQTRLPGLASLRLRVPYVSGQSWSIIQTPTYMNTSVVFSARNENKELKPILIGTETTVADLAKADVFTVFADSSQQALDTAKATASKMSFAGDFQLGNIIGKDNQVRHLVRVWRTAPLTTDASALLGI
jgi:hypothetical protein